jgi:hypothetical protein
VSKGPTSTPNPHLWSSRYESAASRELALENRTATELTSHSTMLRKQHRYVTGVPGAVSQSQSQAELESQGWERVAYEGR